MDKKHRIYSIKKLTLPKWRFKLFLLNEKRKELYNELHDVLYNRKTYRNHWLEFTTGWSRFSIMYKEAGYDSKPYINVSLLWGSLYVFTSQNRKKYIKEKYLFGDDRRWGIDYTHELASVCIQVGLRNKYFSMPWSKVWVRTSKLMKDDSWEHETKGNRKEFYNDHIWGDIVFKETFSYTYRLKNGKTQNVKATITVEEREWRYIILKWTDKFNIVDKSIGVSFSSEVGERSGSYKGGTTGCGWLMRKGETPKETLRRMEKERKF